MNKQTTRAATPSFSKLGACLLYELLTIIAIVFVSTGLFVWVAGDATTGVKRLLLQGFLWLILGAYYVWCWHKSGRTLAMQAWKFKLIQPHHHLLSVNAAIMRYVLATMSISLAGLGFLWAFVDKERCFLHDRLLHSRIVLYALNPDNHLQ